MNKYTVIDLFCGIGGSSLGYKKACFNELLAIDFNKSAIENYKLNFDTKIIQADINKLNGIDILHEANIDKHELDILNGSPPCQGFSTANIYKKEHNERNDLFLKFIRLIDEIQPKIFVIENVLGLLNNKLYMKKIFDLLSNLNYIFKVNVLNAMYCNVPQNRRRVIFIGVRKDLNKIPIFPEKNFNLVSVKSILNSIPNTEDEIHERNFLINKTKNNLKLKFHYNRTKFGHNFDYRNLGYLFSYKRNNYIKPSYTIPASYTSIFHPLEFRNHTVKELLLLSSFPENFKYKSKASISKGVGNSVPPNMMYTIAETIKEKILDEHYGT